LFRIEFFIDGAIKRINDLTNDNNNDTISHFKKTYPDEIKLVNSILAALESNLKKLLENIITHCNHFLP
jgi:hypothetical protein